MNRLIIPDPAGLAHLQLESFERITTSEHLALLRVAGRWHLEHDGPAPDPVLLAEDAAGIRRFEPLQQTAGTAEWVHADARLWWAGYAVPAELVLGDTTWWIEGAGRFVLPEPQERALLDMAEPAGIVVRDGRPYMLMFRGLVAAALVPLATPALALADDAAPGLTQSATTPAPPTDPTAQTATTDTTTTATTTPADPSTTTPVDPTATVPAATDPTAVHDPAPATLPVTDVPAPATTPDAEHVAQPKKAKHAHPHHKHGKAKPETKTDAERTTAKTLTPAPKPKPKPTPRRPVVVHPLPATPVPPHVTVTPTQKTTTPPPAPRAATGLVAPTQTTTVPNVLLDGFGVPPFLLPIYQAAGTAYDVPWEVLAGINQIETNYGRNLNISSAGAQGWMQFMPPTWATYGVDANLDGRKDPYNPADAIFTAARYLHAAGASQNLRQAIFAYNHAGWYVDEVMRNAQRLHDLPSGVIDALTGLTQGRFPVTGKVHYTTSAPQTPQPGTLKAAVALTGRVGVHTATIHAVSGSAAIATADGRVVAMGHSRFGAWIVLQDVYGNRYTYGHLTETVRQFAVPKPRLITQAQAERELGLALKAGSMHDASQSTSEAESAAGTDDAVAPAGPVAVGNGPASKSAAALWDQIAHPKATGSSTTTAANASAATAAQDAGPVSFGEGRASAKAKSLWTQIASGTTRTTTAAPATTTATPVAPVVSKERLFAHPERPNALRAGGRRQLARPLDPHVTRSALEAAARSLGLKPSQIVLRDLKPGARVVAGTVLGRVGKATTTPGHTTSHRESAMTFRIHPAGNGSPAIDPTPLLDGWRLLRSTAVYGPAGSSTLAQKGAAAQASLGAGQALLLSKTALEQRVLHDPRVQIYAAGRIDVATGQIDRRVLATLEYLADAGLDPTVTMLKTGHSYLTSSGNVSEHVTGDAVDIGAINGTIISPATQGPGTITDTTIRKLLQLQGAMMPHQIISLMTFPGAANTLSLPDHYNHIHVGFRPVAGAGIGQSDALGRQMTAVLQPQQWDRLMSRLAALRNPRVTK